MAGSYRHVVDKNNKLRDDSLLDDLGDAAEAVEEMYHIIQHLSGGDKKKIYDAWVEGYWKKSHKHNEPCPITFERFWGE